MMNRKLTDRFSNATRELEEKNAFICTSCGETHEDVSTHDRFSAAVEELEDKNAFVCKSCGGRMISEKDYSDEELHGEGLGNHLSRDREWSKTAEIINSDPSPSGA